MRDVQSKSSQTKRENHFRIQRYDKLLSRLASSLSVETLKTFIAVKMPVSRKAKIVLASVTCGVVLCVTIAMSVALTRQTGKQNFSISSG